MCVCVCLSVSFGSVGGKRDLILLVPDLCLSLYLEFTRSVRIDPICIM